MSKKHKRSLLSKVFTACYCALVASCIAYVAWQFKPTGVISAYGVGLCGVPHHVVLVYGDGTQRIVKGAQILNDKEALNAAETLPAEKANAINICPKPAELKVY